MRWQECPLTLEPAIRNADSCRAATRPIPVMDRQLENPESCRIFSRRLNRSYWVGCGLSAIERESRPK